MIAPAIDAVVVTWQSAGRVERCLASLRREGIARVFVADNGSTDGTVEAAARTDPEATLLRLGSNRGFARAANAGMAASRAPFLLLLNPDAELEPGALASLAEEAARSPRAGLLGPRIDGPDGKPQWDCARRIPTPLDRLCTDTLAATLLPQVSRLRRDRLPLPRVPTDVPALCGAALLVRREARENVGGLDPRFFLYYEDLDWCLRMRRAGWRCRVVPGARARHEGGASASQAYARAYAENRRSEILFFRKHASPPAAAFLQAARAADGMARIAGDALFALAGRGPDGRGATERLSKDLRALGAVLDA